MSLRNSPLTDAIDALYTLWRYESYAAPDPTLFDAVAVGMVLWPDLFKTRKAHVRVTDEGYTVIDEGKEPNCEIGMSINRDEFLKRILDRYLKQNLHPMHCNLEVEEDYIFFLFLVDFMMNVTFST